MIRLKIPPKMEPVKKERSIKNVNIGYRSTRRFRQLVLESLSEDARKRIVRLGEKAIGR